MAIDIIARGLATSLLGSDGKISSDKLPTMSEMPDGATFHPVGALTDPSQLVGKTLEEVLIMMLYGIVNPTFTNPSISIELTSPNTVIVGQPTLVTGKINFDRGAISPPFGTSGFRSGIVTDYLFNGASLGAPEFSIEIIPIAGDNVGTCTVYYEEGEQPLNSVGQDYDNPLPAGSVSASFVITGIYQIYDKEGEVLEFEYFEDEEGSCYQTILTTETLYTKQGFMVSIANEVIGIKQYEPMTQSWLWIGGSAEASLTYFDTMLIEGDSLGEGEDYIQYTHNGSMTGERELRIYIA